jgi:hypothetical protein
MDRGLESTEHMLTWRVEEVPMHNVPLLHLGGPFGIYTNVSICTWCMLKVVSGYGKMLHGRAQLYVTIFCICELWFQHKIECMICLGVHDYKIVHNLE